MFVHILHESYSFLSFYVCPCTFLAHHHCRVQCEVAQAAFPAWVGRGEFFILNGYLLTSNILRGFSMQTFCSVHIQVPTCGQG